MVHNNTHFYVQCKFTPYIFLYTPDIFFNLLKTKEKNIHRGEILEEAVRRSPLKITQLVKRMGISRSSYYNHIADPHLPFETLEQYGKVLQYDFTQDFPSMARYAFEEEVAPYGEPSTLEEAVQQRDYWKNKYLVLLEEYLQEVKANRRSSS